MDCGVVAGRGVRRAEAGAAEAEATGAEVREAREAPRVAAKAAWAEVHRERVEARDTADTRAEEGWEGSRVEHPG